MSLFKEEIAKDVRRSFLHLLEFCDLYDVNGKPVVGLLDREETEERDPSGLSHRMGAIYGRHLVFYVATPDIPRPTAEERMEIDGRFYQVVDVTEEMGVLVIRLREWDV